MRRLPPLPVHAIDILCIMQLCIFGWSTFLGTLTTFRKLCTSSNDTSLPGMQPPLYIWLVIGIWVLSLLLAGMFATPATYPLFRMLWYGFMLILVVAPLWRMGLSSLLQYYLWIQGCMVILWMFIWPEKTSKHNFLVACGVSISVYTVIHMLNFLRYYRSN